MITVLSDCYKYDVDKRLMFPRAETRIALLFGGGKKRGKLWHEYIYSCSKVKQ